MQAQVASNPLCLMRAAPNVWLGRGEEEAKKDANLQRSAGKRFLALIWSFFMQVKDTGFSGISTQVSASQNKALASKLLTSHTNVVCILAEILLWSAPYAWSIFYAQQSSQLTHRLEQVCIKWWRSVKACIEEKKLAYLCRFIWSSRTCPAHPDKWARRHQVAQKKPDPGEQLLCHLWNIPTNYVRRSCLVVKHASSISTRMRRNMLLSVFFWLPDSCQKNMHRHLLTWNLWGCFLYSQSQGFFGHWSSSI